MSYLALFLMTYCWSIFPLSMMYPNTETRFRIGAQWGSLPGLIKIGFDFRLGLAFVTTLCYWLWS